MFLGTFINKLDKKGRVSVPAPFREALHKIQSHKSSVIVYRSYRQQALDVLSENKMQQMIERAEGDDFFSQDFDHISATIFADSRVISFDADGRVILPQEFLEHIGVDEQIAFVGKGSSFQLWRPDVFSHFQKEAMSVLAQKTGRV